LAVPEREPSPLLAKLQAAQAAAAQHHSDADPEPARYPVSLSPDEIKLIKAAREAAVGAGPNLWDAPECWDWSADPEPPDYLIAGLIERGTITVLTADTGAGKSWVAMALSVCVASGKSFLERAVQKGCVIYVDEENPQRIPRSRLRALGMTNEHRDRLHYYSRKGFTVGDPTTNARLVEQITKVGADLLVIDTLMAATTVSEINDNNEVVAFYKAMRAVTEQTGVTILITHHERKVQQGQRSGTGQASMGARQIAGQADGHLTLQLKEKASTDREDGGLDLRTVLVLNDAKDRDGVTVTPGGEHVVIESVKDADRRLVSAAVFSEGAARTEKDELVGVVLEQVKAALGDGMLQRRDIATELGRKTNDGTLEAALKMGEASGQLVKPKYGHYALAAEGVPL
jgi:hypothetical protein